MRGFAAGFILLSLLAVFSGGCAQDTERNNETQPAQREELVIAGSGSNIAVTRQLVAVFNAEHSINIEVPDSIGSGGGITGIEKGSIDLGLTSRALTKEEKENGLKELPYAYSCLAVAAGQAVLEDTVSYEELVRIYKGERTTWANGEPITVFVMYEKDSTNEVLKQEIPGFKEVFTEALRDNRWRVFYNQLAQEQALKETPNAIGFINLSGAPSEVRILKVNNVNPSKENILNGSYRLFKRLNYVYKEPLNPTVKDFIEFTFSQQGQNIITNCKCIPIGK